jgi:hypothetical protein
MASMGVSSETLPNEFGSVRQFHHFRSPTIVSRTSAFLDFIGFSALQRPGTAIAPFSDGAALEGRSAEDRYPATFKVFLDSPPV